MFNSVHNMQPPYKIRVTIYAPMIYTAQCVRFLMGADRLRGEVGGGGGGGLRGTARVLVAL